MINLLHMPLIKILNFKESHDIRGYNRKVELGESFRVYEIFESLNVQQGTIRGLHLQTGQYMQEKIVWCSFGAIHDVVLDLRKQSPTYLMWGAVELSDNNSGIYLPKGVAHGYQTLIPNSRVNYLISRPYHEDHSLYLNPLCTDLKIDWPKPISVLSNSDLDSLCISDVTPNIEKLVSDYQL
jgi:dTDP-4-dehydrorhamnose 3,5-epimerase